MGLGLALVLPCAQSVLADYFIPEQRGRAFGFMFTLAALGEPPPWAEAHFLSTLNQVIGPPTKCVGYYVGLTCA